MSDPAPPPDLRPIHALLQGLIDYAGLFPPAKLSMEAATRNYADYLRSPHSWMLGRFICPVSRLEEFRKATRELLPRIAPGGAAPPRGPVELNGMVPDTHEHHADQPWPMSVLIDGDLDENLDAVFAFNHEHSKPDNGLAVVDAVEIKVPFGPGDSGGVFIDEALDLIPEEVFPFFEIAVQGDVADPSPPDFRGLIAALSGSDAGAKIRTGGITPDAFPPVERVADFIAACHAADVPFKATAGLHHAVRAEHPLSYEPGCPRGTMHGFLNVFVAAALLRSGKIDAAMAADVLREADGKTFVFGERELVYRSVAVEATDIGVARETFALSFGSCSFDEPVGEMKQFGVV